MLRPIIADTPELIDVAYRLRHTSYAMRGWERLDLAEMDIDGHDRHAVHVLALDNTKPVAAVRMIMGPNLPILTDCPELKLSDAAVEFSRFAIPAPKDYDTVEIVGTLAIGLFAAARGRNISQVVALVRPVMPKIFARAGYSFKQIGPAVEKKGSRIPVMFMGVSDE